MAENFTISLATTEISMIASSKLRSRGSNLKIPFWISIDLITNKNWFDIIQPSLLIYKRRVAGRDNEAVTKVNWYMAHAFCNLLNASRHSLNFPGLHISIPSASQWEFANSIFDETLGLSEWCNDPPMKDANGNLLPNECRMIRRLDDGTSLDSRSNYRAMDYCAEDLSFRVCATARYTEEVE